MRAQSIVGELPKLAQKLPVLKSRAKLIARKLPSLIGGVKYLLKTDQAEPLSIGALIEKNAAIYPNQPALLFENQSFTYSAFNAWANRYGNFLLAQGIKKGDVVAIFMTNRPQVLVTVAALAKLGAIASLVNTNQRKDALKHSFNLCNPKAFVIGAELADAFVEVQPDLGSAKAPVYGVPDSEAKTLPEGFANLEELSSVGHCGNPLTTGSVTLRDPCFYIYTSGTTGLPKASIMTHFRWIKASAGFGLCALDLKPGEVLYSALPLYHNNALTVAWSSVLAGGAAMAIRRKFSASHFWSDTRKFNAVAFCYIGELCRYLMNQPTGTEDTNNPVKKMVGNGLRPDVWKGFKERFNISEVYEFYGASEGNIAFVNLLNLDCTVGFCPVPYAIVKYDLDSNAPITDKNGRFIRVKKGETGLLLGEVTPKSPFDGYLSPEASERKLFRNAFKKDDVWFNSGDLMKDIGFRHAQFVDRLGDTFRWKGENVSTTEVDEVVNSFHQVSESTTYGVEVPNADGRAGMSSVVLNCPVAEFDGKALGKHLRGRLPPYAVPVFVRVRSELEATGTFKHRKVELKSQGFDINATRDPIYFIRDGGAEYVQLTHGVAQQVISQRVRI